MFNSENPEYQQLHADIIRYMRFLKDVTLQEELSESVIQALFTFKEVKQNWLGFSFTGNSGRGLGREFAFSLYRNFRSVFRNFGEERITKSHIEKLCLISDGVGRDMISDFTTNLIKEYVANFTQSIARDLIRPELRRKVSVPKVRFNYDTRTWSPVAFELPFVNGDYVLLSPRDMLTKDEAWINRSDLIHRFDDIAAAVPDGQLRGQINDYFQRVLPKPQKGKDPTRKDMREAIAKVIDQYPQVLDVYIKDREEHADEASSVAKQRVELVQSLFVHQVTDFVRRFLDPGGFYRIPRNTHEDAMARVKFLKDVIENKGGHRIFYVDGKPIQREEDLQILYRLTWFAPTSDITREANDGRGPVDFKISYGPGDKTLVEFKLAKNTSLEKSLAPRGQVEVYEKASDPTHPSIKVILYFSDDELDRVMGILKKLGLQNSEHIVLIDGSKDNKPSGSKA